MKKMGIMTVPDRIHFLGRNRYALHVTADRLVSSWRAGRAVDMRDVLIVLPGRRAGRRLTELLVGKCDSEKLVLVPPVCTTPGMLDGFLVESGTKKAAGETARQLAWVAALRSIDPEDRSGLLPGDADTWDLEQWIEVAREIDSTWNRLAGEMRDFADAGRVFCDDPRWNVLEVALDRYAVTLDKNGMYDTRIARMEAVSRKTCRLKQSQVTLAGLVDLGGAVRGMLEQVADRVEVFVFAEPSEKDRFDHWGCVVPEAWKDVEIEIPDRCIISVEDPASQADAVLDYLSGLEGDYSAGDITIGVPDRSILLPLSSRLAAFSIASHPSVGPGITTLAPCKLLSAAADFLDSRKYRDFSTLVRHTDVEAWLTRNGYTGSAGDDVSLPERLDRYYSKHLPDTVPEADGWLSGDIDDSHPGTAISADGLEELSRAGTGCVEMLGELVWEERRYLNQWCEPVCRLLAEVYGDIEADTDDPVDRRASEACLAIVDCLREMHISVGLSSVLLQITSAEAIRILLRRLSGRQATPDYRPNAVEMPGWLELQLDDAPVMIVTSFNDEYVPESVRSHSYLPDSLSRRLGLACNERRYARDACLLEGLISVRKPESIRFVTARMTANGDSLAPSRLLFTSRDGQKTAGRVLGIENQPGESPGIVIAGDAGHEKQSGFRLPIPHRNYDRGYISATQFSTYIQSPYLFYLKYVHPRGIDRVDDLADELDPADFGTLAHMVLERFGVDEGVKDSTDADLMADFLVSTVDKISRKYLGDGSNRVVAVQVEQLKRRFRWFAEVQASRAREGWSIFCTEKMFGKDEPVYLPGDTDHLMPVRGKVDRIDCNLETGRWAIIDYKTGDNKKEPEKRHRKGRGGNKEWIDLQLPVYRHLAAGITGGGYDVELGYMCLCSSRDGTNFYMANWGKEDLTIADEKAAEVIRNIMEGRFGEVGDVPIYESEIIKSMLSAATEAGAYD